MVHHVTIYRYLYNLIQIIKSIFKSIYENYIYNILTNFVTSKIPMFQKIDSIEKTTMAKNLNCNLSTWKNHNDTNIKF